MVKSVRRHPYHHLDNNQTIGELDCRAECSRSPSRVSLQSWCLWSRLYGQRSSDNRPVWSSPELPSVGPGSAAASPPAAAPPLWTDEDRSSTIWRRKQKNICRIGKINGNNVSFQVAILCFRVFRVCYWLHVGSNSRKRVSGPTTRDIHTLEMQDTKIVAQF